MWSYLERDRQGVPPKRNDLLSPALVNTLEKATQPKFSIRELGCVVLTRFAGASCDGSFLLSLRFR